MGSKRVITEKDLKRKEKLKALAAISKPKKVSKKKKTLKAVKNEDITFASEKKVSKLGGKKKKKEDIETEDKSEEVLRKRKKDKSRKAAKKETKDLVLSKKTSKLTSKRNASPVDEVYHISPGDEDCSKGMNKWMTEYHQSRPGLEILQRKIDEFMDSHEKQEEEARQERESRVADDGFVVVKHHKGRKKTTDSESGTAVGSVSQAAVLDKMAKKKNKDVGIDFYRFQKRDAQRNEVMMLQSKFEQDRKRIQQLRAARKFKPY
ncbi:hypothetical protein MKX01_024587 [Papaver californicum]|nr:hypothetical protein MKX01_024587 [Papaver californicum]